MYRMTAMAASISSIRRRRQRPRSRAAGPWRSPIRLRPERASRSRLDGKSDARRPLELCRRHFRLHRRRHAGRFGPDRSQGHRLSRERLLRELQCRHRHALRSATGPTRRRCSSTASIRRRTSASQAMAMAARSFTIRRFPTARMELPAPDTPQQPWLRVQIRERRPWCDGGPRWRRCAPMGRPDGRERAGGLWRNA